MKFSDLLLMSLNNLKRRKLRTVLTVLGVVIGTASVVIMMSLGIGLDNLTTKLMSSYGTMTAIDVYPQNDYNNSGNTKGKNLYIRDETITQFSKLEHVVGVSPVLETQAIIKQGVWEANTNIVGVGYSYLKNIEIGQGRNLAEGEHELKLVVGNMLGMIFTNSKTGKGYWDSGTLPDVDFLGSPLFVIFDTEAYYASQNQSTQSTGASSDTTTSTTVKPPKKYLVDVIGMVKGGEKDYNQYSYGVYTDVEALKAQLKKVYKNKAIPGQPTNKKGKPYKYICYNSAQVYCDSMDTVVEVQKKITDMGFQANSQMEWLEQSKQQSRMIQAVLGGIGAVSLFVAAIGIANTMMMSIYERTKEIGIIKVLGCDMNQIRDMFLIESGFIGFAGGIIGILLSYIVSIIVNCLGVSTTFVGIEGDMSQIPLWLSIMGLIFATLVGMIAGLFPALRAMKLSPLSAIKNE